MLPVFSDENSGTSDVDDIESEDDFFPKNLQLPLNLKLKIPHVDIAKDGRGILSEHFVAVDFQNRMCFEYPIQQRLIPKDL